MLMGTNITDEAYFHNCLGYDVVFSEVVGNVSKETQGEVVLVVRERPEVWSVKPTRFHELHVVICKNVSGGHLTLIIGVYLLLTLLINFHILKSH